MTKLVNRRDKVPYDAYIGRGSQFGNIFSIGVDGTREEVIEKYKTYFYEKLHNDKQFKEAVLNLKGKILACYCHPLKCHGDIIIEYLENHKPASNATWNDFFE